jgi:predicted transcriptional regulator
MSKTSGNSVIFSFKGLWNDPIKLGQVKLFFRKRVPVSLPKRVYFYVGKPVSAVIGYSEATEILHVNADQATDLASDGAISRSTLNEYLADCVSVGVIKIGTPVIFDRELNIKDMRRLMNFHAPQNFVGITDVIERAMEEATK